MSGRYSRKRYSRKAKSKAKRKLSKPKLKRRPIDFKPKRLPQRSPRFPLGNYDEEIYEPKWYKNRLYQDLRANNVRSSFCIQRHVMMKRARDVLGTLDLSLPKQNFLILEDEHFIPGDIAKFRDDFYNDFYDGKAILNAFEDGIDIWPGSKSSLLMPKRVTTSIQKIYEMQACQAFIVNEYGHTFSVVQCVNLFIILDTAPGQDKLLQIKSFFPEFASITFPREDILLQDKDEIWFGSGGQCREWSFILLLEFAKRRLFVELENYIKFYMRGDYTDPFPQEIFKKIDEMYKDLSKWTLPDYNRAARELTFL